MTKRKTYCVIRNNESGKFFDGWYGWDQCVHEDAQIVPSTELPFTLSDKNTVIVVGIGKTPPTVNEVNEVLGFEW